MQLQIDLAGYWRGRLICRLYTLEKDSIEYPTQTKYVFDPSLTAVQLGSNPFSQFLSQLELYSQLQLSLQSDPIALGVLMPIIPEPR